MWGRLVVTKDVDGYLASKTPNGSFSEAFLRDLKAAQRVFKLVPNTDAANTLLADGLHSAQRIYGMGQSKFVQTYAGSPGFTEKIAQEVHLRAANTHAAVLTIVQSPQFRMIRGSDVAVDE